MGRWVNEGTVAAQRRGVTGSNVASKSQGAAPNPVPASSPTQSPPAKADGALERIVKYVPAEIVSAYTMVFGLLAAKPDPLDQWIVAGFIGLFFVVTIVYVWINTTGPVRTSHLIVSPIAFVAWAYPISSLVLGNWFIPAISVGLQGAVIALAVLIVPDDKPKAS